MVRVNFTANLQRHVSAPGYDVPAGTLREVMTAVFAAQPALRGYVLDDQESLRRHVTIFIDGTQIADRHQLSDVVAEGSEVWVMQALSGG